MKVVVVGGTGLVGRSVVRQLADRGHEAVAASPTTGVNTVTGVGLAAALAGADVVIDVSDAPSFDDDAVLEYFQTSSRNLADAEAHAGVGHHVALSIVGAERLPNSGYMRAKVAQEAMVRALGVPYTIVRSTQSFELMRTVADAATVDGAVVISPALVQPVAAQDIASTLADVAGGAAAERTVELAGPDRLGLAALVARILRAQQDGRTVVASPSTPYYGSVLDDATLLPAGEAEIGRTCLADWLREVVAGHETSGAR
jgi:uncharacterized protein YbjT (DUF2867 family)